MKKTLDGAPSGAFLSVLPPETAFTAAYGDPVLAMLTGDQGYELGRQLTANAALVFQYAATKLAANTGIPTTTVSSFVTAVSENALDADSTDWRQIANNNVSSAIDIAMESAGAVPIIGWVARVAFSVVQLFLNRFSKPKPVLPAPLSYNKANDDFKAQAALKVTESLDWTPLFMPPGKAWMWSPQQGGSTIFDTKIPLGGYGTLPGGFTGGSAFQASEPSTHDVLNIYDTTPSAARVGTAAWELLTSNKMPTLFNVDTRPIGEAWLGWEQTLVDLLKSISAPLKHSNEDKPLYFQAQNVLQVLKHPVAGHKATNKAGKVVFDTTNKSYPQIANFYTMELLTRQVAALDTILVALCSEKQAAFKDPLKHKLLMDRRKQLLTHPDRMLVKLDDVPDLDYRNELYQAKLKASQSFTSAPGTGTFVAKPKPMPEASGFPVPSFESVKQALPLLALLGGAGLFWWLGKRRK